MVCILLKISAKKILLRILNDRTDLRESWAFYAEFDHSKTQDFWTSV